MGGYRFLLPFSSRLPSSFLFPPRANLTVLFRGKMTPRSAGDDGEKWQVGRYHRWKRGNVHYSVGVERFYRFHIAAASLRGIYTVSRSSQRSSGSSGISLAAVKVIAIRDRSRITRVARYTSCVNARKFVSPRFLRVCRSRSEQTKLAREARPSSRPRSIPRNETKQNKTKKVKEKEKPFLPLYRALSAISFFPFLASRRDAKFDPRDDSTTTRNR